MKDEVEVYREHEGTIRVAGHTQPRDIARCALKLLENAIDPEFLYIGGNAGQQAMKAMTIMRYQLESSMENWEISFSPFRVRLSVVDSDGGLSFKDGSVWKLKIWSHE